MSAHILDQDGSIGGTYDDDVKPDVVGEKTFTDTGDGTWTPPAEWIQRFIDDHEGVHGDESLPAGCDPLRAAQAVLTLDQNAAYDYLQHVTVEHHDDYTFDTAFMAFIKSLLEGHAACGMEQADWSYKVSKTAGLIYNWSPYTEVRAVTLPYDDVNEPCESVRSYILATFWICVCTAVNTFFSPRQPGISIPGSVVQLLLVPMGRGMAAVLPDWGVTILGTRYTLNPGPWSAKEQLFATLTVNGASTWGNFTGLMVLRLPIFLDRQWARMGFNVLLAWTNQIYGMGMAGLIRRLVVYPTQAVWPSALPTLALNRTLITRDRTHDIVSGWRISRMGCFLASSGIFIIWWWIPNEFFNAIRLFNWMTWIQPDNANLAIVTGSYGGMGYNPISSLDPTTSGAGVMNSPFFAQLQQFVMRAISGIIILILYYKNAFWGAYMPINSNAAFDNTGKNYNLTKVLNKDFSVDIPAYEEYGPPYYGIANLFITGCSFVYYTFTIVYVFVQYWKPIKKALWGTVINTWKRRSVYHGFDDGHTRMIRKYPEVPEWWYGLVLLQGLVISIAMCSAWPTQTPWWAMLVVTGIGAFLTIPWVIIESIASTGIPLNIIWQVIPGVIWPGKPLPQLILLMLGNAFEPGAGGFATDLKYAHYAKMPPRAIFRAHLLAGLLNLLIFCGILEVMVVYFNDNSTLCQWDNAQHMVCASANSVYASITFYGAFGTNNMFALYPILPWCFLIGALLGLGWLGCERYLPRLRLMVQEKIEPKTFATLDTYLYQPGYQVFSCLHPAIALSGALAWAGNNNLSYATLGIYIAFLFQYWLKRRRTAWWSKYAFMIFNGLSVGSSISGLIGTLVFSFGAGKGVSFKWWGNTVPTAGYDYKLYNNAASLKPLPEQGYFGLTKGQFPTKW